MPRTLAGAIIFVRQGLSFSELSVSSLYLLDPYSDYVEVNISLNNFSSLSFLNVYAPPIRSSPTDGRTDSFSPSILLPSKNPFILGDFNCHPSSGTQEVLPTLVGKKYSIGSSPLTSSPSMTQTYLLFIVPLAVAPRPTFPLLPHLFLFLTPGRCLDSDHLPILLSVSLFLVFFPTSVLLPSIFRKLAGMTLSPTLTPTVLLQKNIRLFPFPLLLLSLPLWH